MEPITPAEGQPLVIPELLVEFCGLQYDDVFESQMTGKTLIASIDMTFERLFSRMYAFVNN